MIASQLIAAKRDGHAIPSDELTDFLNAFLAGDVTDYQMSAFLMATYFRGMDDAETDTLVTTMLESGVSLDLSHLPGPRVDKHSTGGVGDKVSLALAPLAAELGLFVPMMSGRGLGHTTGTLDKLEAIPGFQTRLDLDRFTSIVEEVGCAMIGQTAEIAPLDRRLYALRDVTATVPAIPLICASIMSKKLAEGLSGLLLDVKTGSGAFITDVDRAAELAKRMVEVGTSRGLEVRAMMSAMDRPLGRAIGNGLETAEAISCLEGGGPADLREIVVEQAAHMALIGRVQTQLSDARVAAEEALDSGRARERFARMVHAQGGDVSVLDDPNGLVTAPVQRDVVAPSTGAVVGIDPRPLGEAVVALGGGRRRVEDEIDLGVGFVLDVAPMTDVTEGDRLGVVHARTDAEAEIGARVLQDAVRLGTSGTEPRELTPLVVRVLGPDGPA